MNIYKRFTVFTVLMSGLSMAHAGFGLETTRVIYNQNTKVESVIAFNTNETGNLLLQSWLEDQDGKKSADFVLTPPLMKLSAGKKNSINIHKIKDIANDTEKLYWLNVRFIPSSSENAENIIRYSMTNQIKVIYRPKQLENVDFEKIIQNITWQYKQGSLEMNNPTPYYINLSSMTVDAIDITPITYLAPQSITKFKVNGVVSAKPQVEFKYINDFGSSISMNSKIK